VTRSARYQLYGLSLRSSAVLPAPHDAGARPAEVRIVRAPARSFAGARRGAIGTWFAWRRMRDGNFYLRWAGLVECVVTREGREIRYRGYSGASDEALTTYLLGQVLSFALIARGSEPLHATTVLVDDRAVAFLGDCGTGKSTIGAAMLARGYPLVTDDLLSLSNGGGRYVAHPGPGRIKLYPHLAHALLGRKDGTAMNMRTAKRVLALPWELTTHRPAPLGALYVLHAARRNSRVTVEPLTRAEALIEIVRATFNSICTDRTRLERQFAFATALAEAVPVRRLRVPRSLSALPSVCDAVLRDLRT
jgi:hypothetical protein